MRQHLERRCEEVVAFLPRCPRPQGGTREPGVRRARRPGGARPCLGTHSEVHGRNTDPARHMVALSTDNVRADWKRLKEAGVEFVEDPTDYGNLRIATLKDPEGNLVQLLEPLGT